MNKNTCPHNRTVMGINVRIYNKVFLKVKEPLIEAA